MNPPLRASNSARFSGGLQIKQRLIGLLAAGGGVYLEYNFLKAMFYGGEFGVFTSLAAPLLVLGGLLLLFRPDWYGSIEHHDGSGNERAQLLVAGLGFLGMAINGGLWAYMAWFQ